ncbi:hypothetical protein AB0O01_13575 [Streptomyces sp. NPDC093252]|uniref:hypothetical protein n=1 Tax=Streptomyces sp. NPDC093252 TaxID=3154980 RepID=UPI0034426450
MRSRRFQAFVLDVLKNTPGATQVQTLADAGDTKHPCGVAVITQGDESLWQIVGQLADGERHDHEDQPGEGPLAEWAEAKPGDNAEGVLAAAIGRAESPEIARIERWSVREGERPGRQGLTVYFHNGSRAYMRKL